MTVPFKMLNLCFIWALMFGSSATAQLLPPEVQQCVEDGVCINLLPFGALFDEGAVSGFAYLDSDVEKVLLRYEVLATRETTTNAGQTVETFRDIFWLSAQREYNANLGEFHELVLFDAFPELTSPSGFGSASENQLFISTDALLQGTGETSLMGQFEFPPPVAPPSLLQFPLDICLSVGCSGSASLNLLGLNYQDNNRVLQLSLEPVSSFANDVLFVRNRGFSGFGDGPDNQAFSETLTVRLSAAIPEPGSAVVILACGVAASLRRRFPN